MRRDNRRRPENQKWWKDKIILIGGSTIVVAFLILGVISLFSSNEKTKGEINPSQIISLTPDEEIKENTESASSLIGNKVEENSTMVNENTNVSNNSTTKNNTSTNISNNSANEKSANDTAEKIKKKSSDSKTQNDDENKTIVKAKSTNVEETKKLEFLWPVKGEILKAFSIDNLLYSSTLQEWIVHNGVDIKADKASSVCSAADGTIKSIKNDPRYGLTVTIEHSDGYKTVYSNLLTAEFVVEGEKVSKGQNIGTVGNTANFEVADDFHLHFEILKNDEYVDPMIYLK